MTDDVGLFGNILITRNYVTVPLGSGSPTPAQVEVIRQTASNLGKTAITEDLSGAYRTMKPLLDYIHSRGE